MATDIAILEDAPDGSYWLAHTGWIRELGDAAPAHFEMEKALFTDAGDAGGVHKALQEMRYVLSPLYSGSLGTPVVDAHNEWVDAQVLRDATANYFAKSATEGRRLNLQHGDLGSHTVGEWTEAIYKAHAHTIRLTVPGEETRTLKMAPTVYVGWRPDPDVWPLVKNGQLRGISMGGRALRSRAKTPGPVETARMGDYRKAIETSPIAAAWLATTEPLIDMLTALNERLDLLDVAKAKRIPHAYVGSANGMCAHCGKQKLDPAHGKQDPETPVNGGFGDTDGDVSTSRARLPWRAA